MLRSMTGFGRCFLEDERWSQVWEIRSVNNRHLDVRWRLPVQARSLEPVLEKLVRSQASRGRLEISLFLQDNQGRENLKLNEGQADAMLEEIAAFAHTRGDDFSPDYNRLLNISFLWEDGLPENDDALHTVLEQGLATALEDWNQSREIEGKALGQDLLTRILRMEEWLDRIRERAPSVKEERFEQVRERLMEVLDRVGQEMDEGRFMQEIALMADKLDVSEELTRLGVHLERLRELLGQGRDAGRKLDFTIQECFREISTCGNKIQDVQVSRLVVDVKNELEKCREQVQNLE
jgi:TIGR00255 family protein